MAATYDGMWGILIKIPEWSRSKRVKIVNVDGRNGIDTTENRMYASRWNSKESAERWIENTAPLFDDSVTFKAVHA